MGATYSGGRYLEYLYKMATTSKTTPQLNISQIRASYSPTVFTEDQLVSKTDPFRQFSCWFQDALNCKAIEEATAACVSTCSPAGRPSSRVVLMKSYSSEGFVFYTNYLSRKGRELQENPFATMLFYWAPLHRQIRIEGHVTKVPDEVASEYFATRPRQSQLSAWASDQSTEIGSRGELEARYARLEEQYADQTVPVPKPPHWGGYCLVPSVMEFWQGQSTRLHDRIVFAFDESQRLWTLKRLCP